MNAFHSFTPHREDMKKFILPLALVAFSLAACGDDEEPTNVPDATLDVGISDTGDSDAGTDADDDTTVCEPVCDGRECGADGCGGTCGTCADGSSCSAGVCEEDVALNCIGIIQCVNGCTDATCAQGCIGQGTPEAQGQSTPCWAASRPTAAPRPRASSRLASKSSAPMS